MKKLIALYYKHKLKNRCHKIKIHKASTGSLYLQHKTKRGYNKDIVRIADHPYLNRHKHIARSRINYIQKRFLWYYIDIKKVFWSQKCS